MFFVAILPIYMYRLQHITASMRLIFRKVTFFATEMKIFPKKFWRLRKMYYLCTRNQDNGGIAQLVRAHDS